MQEPPIAVRIWPMSGREPGFIGKSIERVQREAFLTRLPKMNWRFEYRASGLNAPAGTVILFQFQARIIALAELAFDEKLDARSAGPAARAKDPLPTGAGRGAKSMQSPRRAQSKGAIHLRPGSIRTFDPVDADRMRVAWPRFRAFGHVKQRLNPEGFAIFKKGLKGCSSSAG